LVSSTEGLIDPEMSTPHLVAKINASQSMQICSLASHPLEEGYGEARQEVTGRYGTGDIS
jgi:hypothetical protein